MSSEDGWPDVPGDTALTIRIPEADAFVRAPFPAHITVLYPFLPAARITPEVHAELAALFADRAPFVLTFAEFRRYPGVLYLPPAPDHPVRALTRAVRERWPEAVPYRGVFGPEGLDPHLTLANDEGPETYERAYDALERELRPMLPVTARVDSVRLIVTDGRAWEDSAVYDLGRSPAPPAPPTQPAPPAQVLRAASTALSRRT
ncbi:2'-5' RNA ligase family protein [Streptomyces sp. CB01635]|uniref:2'-5' RNA ligase family protein n=1 Tax=unclassified Streptomyces TaxID=2593676 RepID=UPI001F1D0A11|nr:2'-5' RNA ligase family protein [Streptomyces sp. CB01635]